MSLSQSQIDDVIDYVCAESIHHKIFYLWRPALKDASDDFVLELAVKAQAMIVSWNVRDFTRAGSFGIRVLTPHDFLISLES
jgi:predicted nucleic acid-binding protein